MLHLLAFFVIRGGATGPLAASLEGVEIERETIVFRREAAGRWLSVREHLSPAP